MPSIKLKTSVNADGILQVQMPPETKDTDLEVMVVFQPLSQQQEQPHYVELVRLGREELDNRGIF